ncbi:MAG: molybdenum cofactor guanylyltransferase [Actinomycetia bacterium]|nr:molybdenum cofactor guanylyltransferase [Actinomycetes bacterium]MCP5031141.1 molybdenum cofactor guanylyltransferase [Actinomycetes bacterium]
MDDPASGLRPGPTPALPLIGAVLCGGRSIRFGRDKALADAGGVPLGSRVVTALRQAGADPVVAVGGSAGDALGLPTVPDRQPGAGPLAGLATALRWAKTGLVLVVPCDLPLLDAQDLVSLAATANAETAAVADDGRPQPSLGCWPASFGPQVQALVDGGGRAWRLALEAGPWIGVDVSSRSMVDADTPAELRAALETRPDNEQPRTDLLDHLRSRWPPTP